MLWGNNRSKGEKDQDEDNGDSKSTSSKELENEDPTKPPVKTQTLANPSQNDVDKEKEGTVDNNDNDEIFPRNVEAHCKVCEKCGYPCKGTVKEHRVAHLANHSARSAGNFGTPQNHKCQAMFAQAYRTLVSSMFISLDLANDIVDAIVDEQGLMPLMPSVAWTRRALNSSKMQSASQAE